MFLFLALNSLATIEQYYKSKLKLNPSIVTLIWGCLNVARFLKRFNLKNNAPNSNDEIANVIEVDPPYLD